MKFVEKFVYMVRFAEGDMQLLNAASGAPAVLMSRMKNQHLHMHRAIHYYQFAP